MKSILLYYSNTGNTELTAKFVRKSSPSTDLWEWTGEELPELDEYELLGFAFPTYNLSVPPQVRTQLQALPPLGGKPVYLLQTYGVMPGKAVKEAGDILEAKGAEIIASHRLPMPESYPPFRQKSMTNQDHPTDEERERLLQFIGVIGNGNSSENSKPPKTKLGFWDRIIPVPGEGSIRKKFGSFRVDDQKCTSCGLCTEKCPEGAVVPGTGPQFRMERCTFCYRCFNTCPQKAISTSIVSADHAYCGPDSELKEMLA